MTGAIGIVGAGICGLVTALALSRRGYEVTVLERDAPPPGDDGDAAFFDWDRRGAGQFRHPHAFLGLMCNILRDNYPDLLDAFMAAGARQVSFAEMMPPHLRAGYVPAEGDDRLWVLMCRRATMETVLRRHVTEQSGVILLPNVTVTDILTEQTDAGLSVTGLQVSQDGTDRTMPFDVVVDAAGRTSKLPGWLQDRGAVITEESFDADIVYYTRHYKLNPGCAEPSRDGPDRPAGDMGYIKYGVFPGDNGNFAIIVCLPMGEEKLRHAVRDGKTFDRMLRAIPGTYPWVKEGQATATTEPFGFGDIKSVWKHFVADGRPAALNYFAVGDAAIRTNPLYGRGCSTGILHAHMLADILEGESDPVKRAVIFDKRSMDELRPIYDSSLAEDKAGIKRAKAIMQGSVVDAPDGLKKWFGLAFMDAMMAAAQNETHVFRGLQRTFNLMEKPGEFLQDKKIQRTIYRYMLKGRKNNAPARLVRGPNRQEMLALVDRTAA